MEFLILLLIALPCASHADETILLRGPQTSEIDFQAELLAKHGSEPFDSYIKRNRVSEALKENLKIAFLNAQASFLNSELSQIKTDWENVIGFAYKADWSKPQREMIQIAFLRLAQSAESSEKTNEFVKLAVQFDRAFEPNDKLFPPPILMAFKNWKHREQKFSIRTDAFSGFDQLLLNGVSYSLTPHARLELPVGAARVTLLSNSVEAVSRVMNVTDLNKFQPERRPLIIGECENAKLVSPSVIKNIKFLGVMSKNCVVDLNNMSGGKSAAKVTSTYSQPFDEAPLSASLPESNPKYYQRPLFWAGAAVVVGAIAVFSSQKHGDNEATHKDGF